MFINYISHEVRTPLNTVSIGLELLQEELTGIDSVLIKDTLADSKASCDIATSTVSEFLTLDKLEGGTLTLELTELNVWDFIQETVKPFYVQVFICLVGLVCYDV